MTGIVQRIVVREHERGLLFRGGEFRELLGPGTHWRVDLTGRLAVEVVDVAPPASRPGLQDLLVRSWSPAERARYDVIEARPGQAAVVYLNGRLEAVLGPGRRAVYRRGVADVTVNVVNVSAPHLAAESAPRPLRVETKDRLALLTCADVR